MSSNRFRAQFSSIGFDFGDPLVLSAPLAGAAAISALQFADDHVLKSDSHPIVDDAQSAHPFVANLDHTPPAFPVDYNHSDAAHTGANPATYHAPHADNFQFSTDSLAPAAHALPAIDPIHLGDSLAIDQPFAFGEPLVAEHHGVAGAQGHFVEQAVHMSHTAGGSGGSPTPSGDPDGQLWAADGGDSGSENPDGHSDVRLEHMDSDGLTNDEIDEHDIASAGIFTSVGLDTAANLYFAEDNNDQFYIGLISTGAVLTTTTIASTSDLDVTNAFVVDPRIDTIYMDLDGGDYTADGGDILKITYNATTGAISSPYNPSNFAINLNDVLVDSTSSSGAYQDGRSFALSADGSTLYYVDDDNLNPADSFSAETDGIYKISTTGDVGQGTAPTPVEISSNSDIIGGFPTDESRGYITALALNSAQGIIYFTTEDGVGGATAIWWISASDVGGTAAPMSLPGGVSFDLPPEFGNGMAFDPDGRELYISDIDRDAVIQLTLSTDGKSFTSGNNDFYTVDTNGDGGETNALTWASLATEGSLSSTSAITTQGSGASTTLLTGAPTISDDDGPGLNLAGYTIRVIGGVKGDGTDFGVTSGAIAAGAGLSGDNLSVSGAQSGTTDGGKITINWDPATETLTLSGDQSYADYKSVLTNIVFQENANTDNTIGSHPTRVIDFIANDGITVVHPGTTDPNEQTLTITLNRAPTVVADNPGSLTAEGGTTTISTTGAGVLGNDSDPDGDTVSLTGIKNASNVSGALGSPLTGAYGDLTLNTNGTYSYTANNTSAIDAAAVGSHPTDVFTYTVSDGDGGTSSTTLTFTIDRPGIANADAISTTESSSVTASTMATGLLGNDVDPDTNSNAGLSVIAVNGSAGNVGNQINFADGSFVTVNADGAYTYDPNHAWDFLPAAASGAPSTGTETFSYTITGGSTQTVTITINGQDSNDILQGTAGADTYNGGVGDDIFKMQDGGNDNVSGGAGNDRFYFDGTLTAADTINGGAQTDTLILGGDYTGANALVLGATTLTSVEILNLHAGFSYDITTNDANVAAGQTLVVRGPAMGVGDSLTFDGSAETDGNFFFDPGAGTNVLTGGAGNDRFNLIAGGNDTAHGGAGNDTFVMDGAFKAADSIDGGAGHNVLILNGDYSAGVTMAAATMSDIAVLRLGAGHSYDLTSNDANLAAGQHMTVNGAALGAGDSLTFNGSAETDGRFNLEGGAGNDSLTGGAGSDVFNLSEGGNDTAHGGGGNDVFDMGGAFTAADVIDGGAGNDVLTLNGDYSSTVTLNSNTITSVERISFGAGHDYSLILNGLDVANGQTLTVDGSSLGASDELTFDGSAVSTGGRMVMTGGAGNDTLIGGSGDDYINAGNGTNSITGGNGRDILTGGTGADTFNYAAPSESTSTGYDSITNFDFSQDHVHLDGYFVNAIDTAVTTGGLGPDDFDAKLARDVGATQLAAHDAVLFTADHGSFTGHTYLVIDLNGVAGYQAGQDIVIDITGATNTSQFSLSTFS